MTKVAYLFPGQGSQQVGMGLDLYEGFSSARAVFDEADEVLGFSLSRLCFEGPEEELKLTSNAQPALVTMSFACLVAAQEALQDALPAASFVAGHSLGEYTALAAAEVFDFATAVYLARERGRLMHEASLLKPGAMVAVIGMDEEPLQGICQETGAWIANRNCPGQIVISGEAASVEKASELAKAHGAKLVMPLQVSGAFHSPLMQPVVEGMSEVLAGVGLSDPAIPIIGNTKAQLIRDSEMVKLELLEQICGCVQWHGSIEFLLSQGVTSFVEFGPGKVLSGLNKRISKDAKTSNISDAKTIAAFAESTE